MLLKHANKCRAWAQVYVGNKYFHGVNGFALDKEKGLKLIEESADRRISRSA
jgi:TPR repeat protein